MPPTAIEPPSPPQYSEDSRSDPKGVPLVVGIYGLPGAGKKHVHNILKERLGLRRFAFYEGSEVIADLVPDGLVGFQKLDEHTQKAYRLKAIKQIKEECQTSGRVGVVTGHFALWDRDSNSPMPVWTKGDWDTFSHIIYLEVNPKTIQQRYKDDDWIKSRPMIPVKDLEGWQGMEIDQLRKLCSDHEVLYTVVSCQLEVTDNVTALVDDICNHSEHQNLTFARASLEGAILSNGILPETVLVIDGDKTLVAEDTGELFWQTAADVMGPRYGANTLQELFSGPLKYSQAAFRQAMLYYEQFSEEQFERICDKVASAVTIRPEFAHLLRTVAAATHIRPVVVTCGLRRIWEKVLDRSQLPTAIGVVGGGRLADKFVVTARVKGDLVKYLQDQYKIHVWVFGDSPLDVPAMQAADQAIVVVGDEKNRSRSMNTALKGAIREGLRARQTVIPGTLKHRLDTKRLPLTDISGPTFISEILRPRPSYLHRVHHSTKRGAAKLLMTPTRDASVAGPRLRDAHADIGRYLSREFLPAVLGLEEYFIPHVQGYETLGHRIQGEEDTTIVALMRGGEPIALGISDILPRAMFVHANDPPDLKDCHLKGKKTVILADSVINNGGTMVSFIEYIRTLEPVISIVVVAGVVQERALSTGDFHRRLKDESNLHVVALRLSGNKFTGKGTTDTGNRLFNTTQLD